MCGLIVDNFAGGGGASTGIEMAIGRSVDIAINHDPDAIAMHTANHPNTLHYCESVFDVDPVQATAGRPVDLCWLSPDCTHFSKAKGSKPVSKLIRGLGWIAVRWILKTKPKVLALENVEEYQGWGPVIEDADGNCFPCPDRKGETFKAFVAVLTTGINADHPALKECCELLGITDPSPLVKGLGYKVEWRELRACDYGAPTIRKRLFMVARCDGRPIVWPAPTHGKPGSKEVKAGLLKPYRMGAECIDFSLPCPSIFSRKRPLAEATMKRIAKGLVRYVIENPTPYFINTRNGERDGQQPRTRDINEPYWTITAQGSQGALVTPELVPFITEHANASSQRNMPADEPLRTQCAQVKGGHFALVSAFLAKHYGGNYTGPGASLEDPVPTITTVDHNALVSSHLLKLRGTCKDGQTVTEPMPTITAGGNHVAEVRAFLLKYYGNEVDGADIAGPIGTITTRDRFGLVTVNGIDHVIVDIGMRMLQPHELFKAQGFPDDYIIDRDSYGKPMTKKAQVARCGNSVPPPFAEALVRANLPELCTSKQEQAA